MQTKFRAGRAHTTPEVGSREASRGSTPAPKLDLTGWQLDPLLEDESTFRRRLASIIRSWGHEVYFHDPDEDDGPRFSVRGVRAYPDLYVKTDPAWMHHDIFPALAVEAKLPKDLNWVARHALKQVAKYSASDAVYEIDGEPVRRPSIILLATPSSLANPGMLYFWRHPSYDTEEKLWAAAHAVTEFMQRLLQDHGAAILRETGFYSNIADAQGNKGPMRWYDLAA